MTRNALTSSTSVTRAPGLPIPEAAIHYVIHTAHGRSLRQIARETGCHASTIMRRVRRCENRRDDPLVDTAFDRLSANGAAAATPFQGFQESPKMTQTVQSQFTAAGNTELSADALRALRRLAETGAVLAVGEDMAKAVVVREMPSGKTSRTTVVDREVAEVMALNEWISCDKPGRIARYTITGIGRSALKRFLSDLDNAEEGEGGIDGLSEAATPFADQHRDCEEIGRRKTKYNLAESPLTALARRKDKDGRPFLADDLVAAGERLREDFELSQMGPRVAQNWDRFMTGPETGGVRGSSGGASGSESARRRVHAALADLGPGLGDVALRCCCFLEGIEMTEKYMGWSARSGKIVLRIALQRLKRHYEVHHGKHGPLIG